MFFNLECKQLRIFLSHRCSRFRRAPKHKRNPWFWMYLELGWKYRSCGIGLHRFDCLVVQVKTRLWAIRHSCVFWCSQETDVDCIFVQAYVSFFTATWAKHILDGFEPSLTRCALICLSTDVSRCLYMPWVRFVTVWLWNVSYSMAFETHLLKVFLWPRAPLQRCAS